MLDATMLKNKKIIGAGVIILLLILLGIVLLLQLQQQKSLTINKATGNKQAVSNQLSSSTDLQEVATVRPLDQSDHVPR